MQKRNSIIVGTLDMLILRLLNACPAYGYSVAQRVQRISRGSITLSSGSLYPALHRLQKAGMLNAKWQDTATGRKAKIYKITRSGRRQLKIEMQDWWDLSRAVALVLQPGR